MRREPWQELPSTTMKRPRDRHILRGRFSKITDKHEFPLHDRSALDFNVRIQIFAKRRGMASERLRLVSSPKANKDGRGWRRSASRSVEVRVKVSAENNAGKEDKRKCQRVNVDPHWCETSTLI